MFYYLIASRNQGARWREEEKNTEEGSAALCIMVLSYFGLFSIKNPLFYSDLRIKGYS